MDGYSSAYVAHNVPLLIVSGLANPPLLEEGPEDHRVWISSDAPPVEGSDVADALFKYFQGIDHRDLAWNAREYNGRSAFKIKVVGRVLQLYPRYIRR